MNNLIEVVGVEIHADSLGRYSLNDLEKAAISSGVTKDIRPNEWMSLDQTKALAEILITENPQRLPIDAKAGRYGGTYVCKELVYAYAMWISPKFHLQVIRTFDAVATGNISAATEIISATKLFTPVFRLLRMIGCDKPSAAISANQAVQASSGTNLLALLGQMHFTAENQEALYFTPTELGEQMSVSGRKFNMLLAEAGFQAKRGDVWEVLDAGKDFSRIYDTGKKHGSGVPIQQIKWAATVMPMLQQGEAA